MDLSYRRANISDARTIFNWANNKEVRRNSFNNQEITWDNHCEWFNAKIENPNSSIFIFYSEKNLIGQVRLDLEDGFYVIDYSIDKKFRGQGYGTSMIKIIIEKLKFSPLLAKVLSTNAGSIKVFERLGFKRISNKSENQVDYLIYTYE